MLAHTRQKTSLMMTEQQEQPEKKQRKQRRRGHGEGSIFQRKDGRWVAQIALEDGKKKLLYRKSKQEAIAALRKAQYELERGVLVTEKDMKLGPYLEHWLEHIHKRALRIGTYIRYRGLLSNHIIPALGSIKLQKPSPQHIETFYAHKQDEGQSASSISSMHGLLHQALKQAVRRNLVARNACDAVTLPRKSRHEVTSLTKEQAQTLLEAVRGQRLEAILAMALTTGMRRGELLALQWQDIDWEGGSVQVRRSVNRYAGQGYKVSEPKTSKGRRKVMLPQFVLDILKGHRTAQLEARLRTGAAWQDRGLVFCSAQGGFMRPDDLVKSFQRVLERVGLPHLRFHDLRHSAATILLTMGVHPKVVQELLGHSQISMTMDIYSHTLPTMQQEAIGKLNAILQG